MYLIVGLGNPGEKYLKSRHNAGFIVCDGLVSQWEYDKYADADVSKSADIVVVKPQTFMNNSGTSVKELAKKYSIVPQHIIVIHDDIDLPFGSTKIVFASGPGGHNGVRSIIDQLGTNEFVRVKVGIAPTDTEGKATKPKPGFLQSQKSAVAKYVLKDFSTGDMATFQTMMPEMKDIIETIVREGRERAMNTFN